MAIALKTEEKIKRNYSLKNKNKCFWMIATA